jgi:hypothetical protein
MGPAPRPSWLAQQRGLTGAAQRGKQSAARGEGRSLWNFVNDTSTTGQGIRARHHRHVRHQQEWSQQGHSRVTAGSQQGHSRVTAGSQQGHSRVTEQRRDREWSQNGHRMVTEQRRTAWSQNSAGADNGIAHRLVWHQGKNGADIASRSQAGENEGNMRTPTHFYLSSLPPFPVAASAIPLARPRATSVALNRYPCRGYCLSL